MNKGRLVLGFGFIILSAVIFYISRATDLELIFDEGEEEVHIITTNENLPDIHSIKADGALSLQIKTGDTERIKYVFNDNRYENKSKFEDGILSVDFAYKKKGFRLFGSSSSGVKAYVTVKKLKHIEMDGVGSIKSTNTLNADAIKVINEGTGSIKLKILATKISGKNDGVGSMNIVGSADTARLFNQGVGSINAEGLKVQFLHAINDGVGSMEVCADKEISLRNSGVGSIHYTGDAKVISSRSEGIGSISKR